MNLRVSLACMLAGTAGCAAIANLESYSSGPTDAGEVIDGAAPTDGSQADALGAPVTASCKELLAADPTTANRNGFYLIDPDGVGANAPVRVFCEMSLDSGGWTLVGRSASAAPFGWTSNTGTPADMTLPYSLDVTSLRLMFSQILLAGADGKSLDASTRAYRVSVPLDFLDGGYATTGVKTSSVITVFGDCNPVGGPEMLRWTGYTARTDTFFFRDINGIDQTRGLLPTGFNLSYPDCTRGGSLDGVAGLLFVR